MAMIPHMAVMKAIQTLGVIFLSTRLLGISKARYVTNTIDTAVWNCESESPRSASSPYKRALPILTLPSVSSVQV